MHEQISIKFGSERLNNKRLIRLNHNLVFFIFLLFSLYESFFLSTFLFPSCRLFSFVFFLFFRFFL
jgi:hypothetical protein